MPTLPFPWSARPDAHAVDALLAGTCQPEEAPAELRTVAEVFAALRAPADQREVAGWDQALSTYRGLASLPEGPSRSRRQRPRLIAWPLRTKLAAAAGAAVVTVLGGGLAAAYTGSLPVSLQRVAHSALAAAGVPDTRPTPTPTPNGPVHPVGPSATGSAVYGLCRSYQQAKEHGNADLHSVAFHKLVSAAGGAGQVPAFCAAVQHPGPDHSSAGPPGRRVGQSGSPGHTPHPQKTKTTPPGKKKHGGGNQHGKPSP